MSGKMKHSRGKVPLQSKKRRSGRRSEQSAVVHITPAVQKTQPEVIAATAAVHSTGSPKIIPVTPKKAPATFNYPNILNELRNIVVLFGVILAAMTTVALLLR